MEQGRLPPGFGMTSHVDEDGNVSMANQTSYPSSNTHGNEGSLNMLAQLVDFTAPLHNPNYGRNAISLSPSSPYYGSVSPDTVFSPIRTPADASTSHYPQHQAEVNPSLFPASHSTGINIPNHLHDHKYHFYTPSNSLPSNMMLYAPTQRPPASIPTTATVNLGSPSFPAPNLPPPTPITPQEITINNLISVCPSQDIEELRERHYAFANDLQTQELHLRVMWAWHVRGEKPSNEDLLKFHRANRRMASTSSKGTGSRGGAEGYTCLWPGCAKADQPSRSDRAQEHALIHLGLKPFQCPHCGSGFTRHNELKRHGNTCKTKKTRVTIVNETPTSRASAKSRLFASLSRQGKKTRAARGVSSDPSSGATSPTSPSAPGHQVFPALTVESQERLSAPPHQVFINEPNPSNPTSTVQGYGEQFPSAPFGYFIIPPHVPPVNTGATGPSMYGPPLGNAPASASVSASTSSPPRLPYANMPNPFASYGSQQPYGPQVPYPYNVPNDNFPQDNLDHRHYTG